MDIYGTPGAHARSLYRRRSLAAAALGAAAAVLCAAALAAAVTSHLALAAAALGAAAAAAWGARRRWSAARRADAGRAAEARTLKALRRSGWDGAVFCGLDLGGGGDADLVCVDPDEHVSVVEVKTVRGTVTADGATLLRDGAPLPVQPQPQVLRQRAALARLGIAAAAVVVASEARFARTGVTLPGAALTTSAGLPHYLADHPGQHSPGAGAVLAGLARDQHLPRRRR